MEQQKKHKVIEIPEEKNNELRSGIVAGFDKTLNEALQIGPTIRYSLQNRVKPSLMMGVLKGRQGTPGLVAALSAEKDELGVIRLATTGLKALKEKDIILSSNSAVNTVTDLRTVPTGQRYYLMSAVLSFTGTVNNAEAYLYVNTTATAILHSALAITATYHTTDHQSMFLSFGTPVPFEAGDVFRVNSDAAACTAFGHLVGWLEDA